MPAWVNGRDPDQRIVEASALLPSFGGVTGWAALRWHGGTWFDGTRADDVLRPVTLATGYEDVRNQAGVVISQERLGPVELVEHDAMTTTSLVRSLCFEMRYARSLVEAVVAADMAAYSDLVSLDELTAYAISHPGWTGIPQCRKALGYVDENSWSPQETRLRMLWTQVADLPRPRCNAPVFDHAGRHVATPDLIDPESGLVAEYDGEVHLDVRRRRHDVGRLEALRELGLEVVSVVAGETATSVTGRLMSAYRRTRRSAAAQDLWTLTSPSWWTITETVDQRRSLSQGQRSRLLRRGGRPAA